jgi:hyperosmotically inducible periplasmic protein
VAVRWVTVCIAGAALAVVVAACDATREAVNSTGEKIHTKLAPVDEKLGDTSIKLQITSKFADDADVKSRQIRVDVKEGHVTLTGSQPTFEGRRHAEQIARDVKGVVSVDSKLTIDPPKGD